MQNGLLSDIPTPSKSSGEFQFHIFHCMACLANEENLGGENRNICGFWWN